MSTFFILVKRNVKLFFKDKGMFFTALITPGILLVLYATFLSNVYRDSFLAGLPQGVTLSGSVMNGLVAGQLTSSLLSVSCITVAFCSNFLMVQDKASGKYNDFLVSPVNQTVTTLAYYTATLLSTLIVCYTATAICLCYTGIVGWYLSAIDVICLFLDVTLLVFFGTAFSSLINVFLSSQGQISAVGTIVSAGYGFICGAYMPISTFSKGLQKVLSFFPGTYGTAILRTHATNGVFSEMQNTGMPEEAVTQMKGLLDCEPSFFGTVVSPTAMYLILAGSVALLVTATVLLYSCKKKSK